MRLKYLGRALYEVNIKGKEVFPIEIEHLLWGIKEMERAEFRIVKYAEHMNYLKLQIEFHQGEKQAVRNKIISHLQDKLGIDVEVEFVAPGELPAMDIKTPRVIDLARC